MSKDHDPAASAADDAGEDFAAMFEAQDNNRPQNGLNPGERVQAVIIAMSGDSVFLDVGVKRDGIMDKKDILDAQGMPVANIGDTVEVWVTAVNAQEIRLSRSMSGSGVAALEDARDNAIPVEGRVGSLCKGGYMIETLGKSAFCPGSQMDAASMPDPDNLVGRTLQFLVTRVENKGRNIVLSRRALVERERREALEKLLAGLKVGDILDSTVTRLAPYGAFVELAPSVEGMAHISELSWGHIENPEEAVKPGDCIKVKLLDIRQDAKGNTRISLSRKQAEGDPWNEVEKHLSPGRTMQGKVVRLAPFGAFVELFPGIDGLVHLSEMSFDKRVRSAGDILSIGEIVNVVVKDISIEKRRISLSLRDAGADPWADAAERFPVGALVQGTVEKRAPFGLFVELAPGVTGLMPNSTTAYSRQASALAKLTPGESVSLAVQALDVEQRRITLAPEDGVAVDDHNRQHGVEGAELSGGLSVMALALQNALKARK
ncbi:MAG: S1 RNA-binding domain-containing protein [Deltaproteobacteria bacterium]|nr:S1 RNA-binding domain-containing protein [Deltaproteobacteria bacterium]